MQLTARPKGGEGIPLEATTNIAMTTGNELRFIKIIDCGYIKEWVGFGWIVIAEASHEDFMSLPFIKRDA